MTKIQPAKKEVPAAKHKMITSNKSSLPSGAQKILNVAAALCKQKETDHVSRDDIAAVVAAQCGISGKSTVANAFTCLKKANLISMNGKDIEILEQGKEQADTSQIKIVIPQNTQEYLDSVKELRKFNQKECQILDELADGQPHPKADVAAAIGYKLNSTFANLLTGLKKAGVIKLGKELQLTDEMRKYE